MEFYFIINLFIFLILFVLDDIKSILLKKFSYFIVIILSFFIVAFRFDVGFDYVTYYNAANLSGNLELLLIWEPLTLPILKLAHLFNQPQLFFIIYSTLTYIFLLKAISKLSIKKDLSLGFYLLFPLFYYDSFSLVRQHLAIAIFLYNLINVKEEKKIKFIFWLVIGSLFHYASLLTMIIYPLRKVKLNQYVYICTIVISFIIGPLLVKYLVPYLDFYGSYIDGSKNTGGGSIILYFVNIIGLLFFFNFNRIIKKEKNNLLYYNSLFIGILLYNIFNLTGHIGFRMFEYFGITIILIFPYLINCFRPLRAAKFISLFLLFLFSISYIYVTSINPVKASFTPYQNILFIDQVKFK